MRIVSVILAALALCAGVPEPTSAQLTRDDCVEIGVQSNGFHTNLLIPSEALDTSHPLRRLFPDARWLIVGWGDEDFFREPGGGTPGQGLRAVVPGGRTVVHAIALDVAPEQYFVADPPSRIAVTDDDAAGLAQFIEREIALTPDGEAVIVATGHQPGRSYFLRGSNEDFSLFNNCNHWTARGLRAAGLQISNVLTERDVMDQAKALASTCPDAPAP